MSVITVRRSVADVVKAIDALPPLPAIALRVVQVAQDPRASASDLALVVSADPGLSARVLRIANSAVYRRAREVTSVQEALVVLGFQQARNVAVSAAITGAYAPDSRNALFRIEHFWRHSLAVAFQASEYAAEANIDAPSAFTAGILHNMGRLAMFYADPAGIDQAVAEVIRSGRSLEHVEWELLGYNHGELGALLGAKWKLPANSREAIARHHADASANPAPSALTACVARADRFCLDNGILPGYVIPEPETLRRLPNPGLQRLLRQVDQLMELILSETAGALFVESL